MPNTFNSPEWWSYEVLILPSGLLPNPELETSMLSIWYVCLFIVFNPSSTWHFDPLKTLDDKPKIWILTCDSLLTALPLLICTTLYHMDLGLPQGLL